MIPEIRKFDVPPEIQMMAESIGFGRGYERTYRTFVVYVVRADGNVSVSSPRTDRFFKTRNGAKNEADRINNMYLYRYDRETGEYIPKLYAFVKEIEVTERVV